MKIRDWLEALAISSAIAFLAAGVCALAYLSIRVRFGLPVAWFQWLGVGTLLIGSLATQYYTRPGGRWNLWGGNRR